MKNKNKRHTIKDPPSHGSFKREKGWKIYRSKKNEAEITKTTEDGNDEYPAHGAAASSYYSMSAWYDLLNLPPLYHSL